MTVLIVLIAPVAGRFSDRIGSRWLMGAGLVLLERFAPLLLDASASTRASGTSFPA